MNSYITGRHVAAARTLAGLSVRDLAATARIGSASVSRVEKFGASPVGPSITKDVLQAIFAALEHAGVEIRENGVVIVNHNRWTRSVTLAVASRQERHNR